MSARPITMVLSLAVLLLVSGSVVVEITVAMLVKVPLVLEPTDTVMVYEAELPTAMVPSVQVGTPLGSSAQPAVETNVTPAGNVSLTTTPVASESPALLTVIV